MTESCKSYSHNDDSSTNPYTVADDNLLPRANTLRVALNLAQRVTDGDDGTVGANATPLANDYVGNGGIHDHAVAVDEGRAANTHPQTVVHVDRRFDEGRVRLKRRIPEGHLAGYGTAMLASELAAPVTAADDAGGRDRA